MVANDSQYLNFKPDELKNILIISGVFGFLTAISYVRFSLENNSFIFSVVSFCSFIFIMLVLRQFIMKWVALKSAFEIDLRLSYFNKYGLKPYETLRYRDNEKGSKIRPVEHSSYKGVPFIFISILVYILSFGFIIFPAVWTYKITKIKHLFIGTKEKYDAQLSFHYNVDISQYRRSKALMAGFVFYFFFAILVKFVTNLFDLSFYNWYVLIIFWFAFSSIIPIIGTEGYLLYRYNWFAYISVMTILILGLLSLLIFSNLFYVLMVAFFSIVVTIFYWYWKVFV